MASQNSPISAYFAIYGLFLFLTCYPTGNNGKANVGHARAQERLSERVAKKLDLSGFFRERQKMKKSRVFYEKSRRKTMIFERFRRKSKRKSLCFSIEKVQLFQRKTLSFTSFNHEFSMIISI